ncbi:Gfo/Idh/MocA family protein [Brachybacterium nesterenkovii]|uniref:Gfo/Idh/MocA family protein n=1 Tax=Brachybacterium nesterenkovii TaxID=47847 RepID=UPI00321B103E
MRRRSWTRTRRRSCRCRSCRTPPRPPAHEDVGIVVNLTIPAAHAEVDRRILEAGKHVWSEKPIAMASQEARELLALADEKGLRLACAPDTMLSAGIQTALRAVASGEIGDVLTGSFVFQTGGPDSWHPSPEFLFTHGAGPLFDMGPYYVSAAVRVFGPVARVMAVSSTARDTRVIGSGPKAGTEFPVDVPTHHAALLTFASRASAQAVFSFQSALPRIGEIEVSGTEGSIALPDPNMFVGDSTLWAFPEGLAAPETRTLPVPEVPFARGAGVVDLARFLRDGVPEQASGAMAAHVLDVLIAIRDAAAEGRIVDVDPAGFTAPEPLPEDWDPTVATL